MATVEATITMPMILMNGWALGMKKKTTEPPMPSIGRSCISALLLPPRQFGRRLQDDLLRGHFGRQRPRRALHDDLAHRHHSSCPERWFRPAPCRRTHSACRGSY